VLGTVGVILGSGLSSHSPGAPSSPIAESSPVVTPSLVASSSPVVSSKPVASPKPVAAAPTPKPVVAPAPKPVPKPTPKPSPKPICPSNHIVLQASGTNASRITRQRIITATFIVPAICAQFKLQWSYVVLSGPPVLASMNFNVFDQSGYIGGANDQSATGASGTTSLGNKCATGCHVEISDSANVSGTSTTNAYSWSAKVID
jgi:hypothetical protein